jgi:GDP-4-dehydro-6-deoxy-D-mannose reductase
MSSNDRVLVTGAAGFIGSHVAGYLRRSVPADHVFSIVHHLKRRVPQTWACDLTNVRSLQKLLSRLRPTLIFHTAGRSRGSVEELMTANILTTLNLLEATARLDPSIRVVLLGSAAEYGNLPSGRPSRSVTMKPLTPYAWSKCCQTLLAQQQAAQGQNVIVARLFNLTGPRLPAWFVAGHIAREITIAESSRRHWITVGNLRSRRDFLDVRDAARAIVLAAERGQSGRAYEICSGQGRSIREILNLLLRETPRRLRVRSTVKQRSSQDVPVSVGDPRALRRWGWAPLISLEDSLRDTLYDYRGRRSDPAHLS